MEERSAADLSKKKKRRLLHLLLVTANQTIRWCSGFGGRDGSPGGIRLLYCIFQVSSEPRRKAFISQVCRVRGIADIIFVKARSSEICEINYGELSGKKKKEKERTWLLKMLVNAVAFITDRCWCMFMICDYKWQWLYLNLYFRCGLKDSDTFKKQMKAFFFFLFPFLSFGTIQEAFYTIPIWGCVICERFTSKLFDSWTQKVQLHLHSKWGD